MAKTKKRPEDRISLKKIISYYKPHWKLFLADMFFATLGGGIALVIPLLVRLITGDIVNRPDALQWILIIAAVMVALIAIEAYCTYFTANYGHVMGAKMEYTMRAELFEHYQKLSFSFYDNQKVGSLMSRIGNDLFDIAELAHHGPEDLFISLMKLVGSLIIMAVALAGVVVLVLKRRTIAYHLRPAPVDQGRCLMQAAKSPGVWLFVLVCVGLSIWLVWGV